MNSRADQDRERRSSEIWTAPDGRRWKIVTLPDRSDGETVLAVEVKGPPKANAGR